MDADDDCPVTEVERLHRTHGAMLAQPPTSIVFAVREFETWFLAAGLSGAHHSRLRTDAPLFPDSELIRDAKGRFRDEVMRLGLAYSETIDQPKYTGVMPLLPARERSPSFDKLVRDLTEAFR